MTSDFNLHQYLIDASDRFARWFIRFKQDLEYYRFRDDDLEEIKRVYDEIDKRVSDVKIALREVSELEENE